MTSFILRGVTLYVFSEPARISFHIELEAVLGVIDEIYQILVYHHKELVTLC